VAAFLGLATTRNSLGILQVVLQLAVFPYARINWLRLSHAGISNLVTSVLKNACRCSYKVLAIVILSEHILRCVDKVL
jgi:hypothetical protein